MKLRIRETRYGHWYVEEWRREWYSGGSWSQEKWMPVGDPLGYYWRITARLKVWWVLWKGRRDERTSARQRARKERGLREKEYEL